MKQSLYTEAQEMWADSLTKFENLASCYFYTCMMNGSGEYIDGNADYGESITAFDVSDEESELLDLDGATLVHLVENSNGFVWVEIIN